MDRHIHDNFSTLAIEITPRVIRELYRLVQRFEVRGSHSVALNSQLLAVDPIVFKDTDKTMFFDIFNVQEKQLKMMIKKIPTIDNNYRVVSDPMNCLCIYLVNISFTQIKNSREQYKFAFTVLKYLHYKFFTSLTNHYFRHGAKEEVMQATVNRLTKKFDIMIYGTWKRVWEARCEELLSKKSIHFKTFRDNPPDDEKFLYVISDIQSRCRERIKKIANVFYSSHEKGIAIKNVSSVIQHEEETSLRDPVSLMDIMITNIINELPNPRIFIDPDTVRRISSGFSSINASSLKQTLTKVSNLASDQMRLKQLDIEKEKVKGKYIIGLRILVRDIVKSMYRYTKKHKLSFNNKAQIYVRYKNAFSSSRIVEPDILNIKDRVSILIEDIVETRREVTKSSLKIAVTMYIVYRALTKI